MDPTVTTSLPALLPPTTAECAQRWSHGESLLTLAAACGISKEGLRKRIILWAQTEQGKDYKQLVKEVLITRTEDCYEELSNATDSVAVTRACAKLKYNQFIMERRLPDLFGLKQQDQDSKIVVIVQRNADNNGNNTQTIDVSPCNESEGSKI